MNQPWLLLGNPCCREGEAAPGFALPDAAGRPVELAQQLGHWVLLYFYPRDNTPLCTREACELRDHWDELQQLGVRVLGISLNDSASHARFAAQHQLPFPLLSDRGGEVAYAYSALVRLGPLRLTRRFSFLIDPQGRVRKCYFKVDVSRHATDVLTDLRELQRLDSAPRV